MSPSLFLQSQSILYLVKIIQDVEILGKRVTYYENCTPARAVSFSTRCSVFTTVYESNQTKGFSE